MISSNGSPEGDAFCKIFQKVGTESEQQKREWLKLLTDLGVAAAHPDDGWVDRKENSVILCYSYFWYDPQPDDIIVLGNYEQWRQVVVIKVEKSKFGITRYYFEDIQAEE